MATNIDLTTPGSSTTIGGAVFTDSANIGSGTGQYNTFLAISDNDGNEAGFNSDDTPALDPSNTNIDHSKTHTVLLSTVPIFTDPNTGIQYYEFRVDLNESNSNPNGQISLDTFQIYSSASGAIESLATLQAQTLEYDMDAGLDRTLLLSEVSTGSGTDDYAVFVPVSNFAGLDPATTYLYLYVRMGFDAGPDFQVQSGFEEWNIQSAGTITGTKFSDTDGDGIKDAGEGPIAGVTVFIDNDFDTIVDATDNNGILDAGERYTITDASGNYTFFGVPVGTWRVDEIVPAGYTQTTGDFETVTVTLGGTSVVDPIGNKPDIKTMNIEKNAAVTGGTANATTDVITYTYTLTNTGNTPIAGIVVKDDNGTPGNTSDDFTLTLQSGDADSDSQLDLTETWSYSATKSVTQAMLDAGNDITNIVTATGTGAASDSDDATVDVVQQKSLNIDKNAAVTGGTANATTDVITYTYTLTNTGNAPIAGIVVRDNNGTPGNTSDDFTLTLQSGDGDSDSQLDVTETWSYTATKSVTQAMLDAGNDITNIVTATGTGAASDSDDATVDVVQQKSLNIDKNASVTGGTANATTDVITYAYTLTNTGNAAIAGIVVKDDNGTPGNTSDDFTLTLQSGDADSDSQLDVNETWSYTATKSVTQAMLDAGNDITNIVTATGTGAASDSDDATVDVVQQKSLNIDKNASVTGGTANATTDVITYTYTLTNTGNAAIAGIVVKDDNGTPGNTSDDFTLTLQSGDADSDSQLDVNETWSYTSTKSVTQAMLDAGNDITNIVTATGTGAASDSDDATVDVVQSKSLNIDKNASVTGGTANATTDVITYTYTLTNTGNAAIAGIVVKDDNGTPGNTSDDFTLTLQSGDADSDSQLDLTETWSYTATKSVTQAMLDAGNDITNIVTATGTGAASDSDDATVDVVQQKSLNIDKNASVTGGTANSTSDVITYTYTLTNTGNTAIGSIVVKDDNGTPGNTSDDFTLTLQSGDADSDSQLDVNETWSYTSTKSVTQAMLDAGNDITNIVTATGNGASDSDDATVDVVQDKSLNIEKNASVTGGTANATTDVITYTYTLTNTGNSAIAGIVVKDDNGTPGNTSDDFTLTLQSGDADSDSQLDLTETWSYTSTKSVTQAMLDAGNDITNIVTANGTGAPSDSDDATVDVVQSKSLNIEKNASVTGGTANATTDVITYTYTLTNTGNAAIGGIVVKDDNGTPGNTSDDFTLTLQSGDGDSDSMLDVNETWSYTSTKSVTQAMLDAGNDITNIVTANGTGAPSDSDDATVDVVQSKSLNINKNASVTGGTANATTDVITYTYTLTNTGNSAIAGIVVKDDNGTPGNTSDDFTLTLQSGDGDSDSMLDVNETWSYTSTKSVTQAMLDAGNDITNIVTANGTGAPSDSDDATVDVVQSKSLNIEKNASVTGGKADATTDVITYTYTLTNTGNTAIGGIVVKDDNGTPGNTSDDFTLTLQSGDGDSDSQLDVNETWSYSATKSVTQAMLDAGTDITNIVTATGDGASDTDDAVVDVVAPVGDLSITKASNIASKGAHADKVGDVITYKIVVDNTGGSDLTNVVVTDQVEGHAPVILTPGNSTLTGDVGNDGVLGVNETWTYLYKYTLTAEDLFQLGDDNRLYNIATVDSDQTNPESTVLATDLGPAVKTYGMWALSTFQKFWDGIAGNEAYSATVTDGFPMSDITRPPYANDDATPANVGKVLDPVTGTYKAGLLIGDWNLNGETDVGEQTLYYSQAEAVAIMTASGSTVNQDVRYALDREMIASWLNYQAGNPVVDLNEGGVGDTVDAQDVINWAIDWIQTRTADEGGSSSSAGDGSLTFQAATWKILASSSFWTTGIDADGVPGVSGVSPVPMFNPAGDIPGGAALTSLLNEYNDHGTILGVHIALM